MDRSLTPEVVTVAPSAFTETAAGIIRETLLEAVGKGEAAIALSGGETPKDIYALLGRDPVGDLPYEHLFFFFGDERWVPAKDPASNAGEAIRSWLMPRRVPMGRIHPFLGKTPNEARESVENALRELARLQGEGIPHLDLTLLGLGDDGHTASLFPGSPVLDERDAWTAETRSPKPPPVRLTLTLPVLNASRRVLFLVKGTGKRDALARLVARERELVAGRVSGPEITILADLEAASGMRLT